MVSAVGILNAFARPDAPDHWLQAAVYTADLEPAFQVVNRLKAARFWSTTPPTNVSMPCSSVAWPPASGAMASRAMHDERVKIARFNRCPRESWESDESANPSANFLNNAKVIGFAFCFKAKAAPPFHLVKRRRHSSFQPFGSQTSRSVRPKSALRQSRTFFESRSAPGADARC